MCSPPSISISTWQAGGQEPLRAGFIGFSEHHSCGRGPHGSSFHQDAARGEGGCGEGYCYSKHVIHPADIWSCGERAATQKLAGAQVMSFLPKKKKKKNRARAFVQTLAPVKTPQVLSCMCIPHNNGDARTVDPSHSFSLSHTVTRSLYLHTHLAVTSQIP